MIDDQDFVLEVQFGVALPGSDLDFVGFEWGRLVLSEWLVAQEVVEIFARFARVALEVLGGTLREEGHLAEQGTEVAGKAGGTAGVELVADTNTEEGRQGVQTVAAELELEPVVLLQLSLQPQFPPDSWLREQFVLA